jgi:CDP-2,3-bis-(O-geranylgeranyl)-sn-glycerol synthase
MLVLANGAPVLVALVFGRRWDRPIDGGLLLRDHRPFMGSHKTWRGLISGSLASGLFSSLAGFGLLFGCLFGLLALVGDATSSFIKRRMGLQDSARALGLDQIPEALLPMLLAAVWLPLGWLQVVLVTGLFVVVNILLSPVLHRLGIRGQPH